MKKTIFGIFAIVLTLASCVDLGNGNVQQKPTSEVVDSFFDAIQNKFPDWIKTDEGQKEIVKAFQNEMLTNIEFAKACASYRGQFDENAHSHIRSSESIAPYTKDDGEEGELKAFEFEIYIKLAKPLYNGDKTIRARYEIISTIPSTVEDHGQPYVEYVDSCSVIDSYINMDGSSTGRLDLGNYIIGKNTK